MSLQEFKIIFWWEWAHRFLGRVIGILFLLPLVYFTYKVGFKNKYSDYFYNIQLDLASFDVLEDSYSKINTILD